MRINLSAVLLSFLFLSSCKVVASGPPLNRLTEGLAAFQNKPFTVGVLC